ncbi:MAG: flagellar basal body P-ring formation chaperone FlgA [Gammaproteobacteria bacterium]
MPLTKTLAGIIAAVLALTALALPSAAGPLQDLTVVQQRAREFLVARLGHASAAADIRVQSLDSRLSLAECGAQLEAFTPSGARLYGNTSVGVRCCAEPNPWSVYVSAYVRAYGEVVVAARTLARGAIIDDADLKTERRDLTTLAGGFESSTENIVGKQLRRPLQAGEVVATSALLTRPLIKRGEQVTILARSGAVEIKASGIAMRDAALGERLAVRNLASQRIVEGKVVADHRIEIEL